MASSIYMSFEGLEEIKKKLWEVSSEESLKQINKKIIKSGQEHGKSIIARKMPKSDNLEKSGPKRGGFRTVPGQHSIDAIPVDGLKSSNGQVFGFIGWRPANNDENFYAKFFEEGVDQHFAEKNHERPVPSVRKLGLFGKASKEVSSFISEMGLVEYQKKLEEVFGSDHQ